MSIVSKRFALVFLSAVAALLLSSCQFNTSGLSPANDLPEEVIEAPPRALVIGFADPESDGTVSSFAAIDDQGLVFAKFIPDQIEYKPSQDPSVLHVKTPEGKPLFIDMVTKWKIENPKVTYLNHFDGDLAPAQSSNDPAGQPLCGYADRSGNMRIPAQWNECWPFRKGVAVVVRPQQIKNVFGASVPGPNRYGLIDRNGKELMPVASEWVSPLPGGRYALRGPDFAGVFDIATAKQFPLPQLARVLAVSKEAAIVKVESEGGQGVNYWKAGATTQNEMQFLAESFNNVELLGANVLLRPGMYQKRYAILRPDRSVVKEGETASLGEPYLGVVALQELGRTGLVDSEGKWLLQPQYGYITKFNHGWAIAADSGSTDMIGVDGKVMAKIPCNVVFHTARFAVCDGREMQRTDTIYNRAGKQIRKVISKR